MARGITRNAVREARAEELRVELLNSERLKDYFEDHTAEQVGSACAWVTARCGAPRAGGQRISLWATARCDVWLGGHTEDHTAEQVGSAFALVYQLAVVCGGNGRV